MWKTTCANELVKEVYNQNFILWENSAFFLVPSNILSPPFQRKWTADKTDRTKLQLWFNTWTKKWKKCIYPRREYGYWWEPHEILRSTVLCPVQSFKKCSIWVKFNKFYESDSRYVGFKIYASQDTVVGSNERTRDNVVMEVSEPVTKKG
jgi:hypothetical protein